MPTRTRKPRIQPPKPEDILPATDEAIAAARASGTLGPEDAGAVAVLRSLAVKIATEQRLREMALEWANVHQEKPPSVDNVSIPTYLKFCEALGMTPVSRTRIGEKKPEAKGGKLVSLQGSLPGKTA